MLAIKMLQEEKEKATSIAASTTMKGNRLLVNIPGNSVNGLLEEMNIPHGRMASTWRMGT